MGDSECHSYSRSSPNWLCNAVVGHRWYSCRWASYHSLVSIKCFANVWNMCLMYKWYFFLLLVTSDYSSVDQEFQLDAAKLTYSFNLTIVNDDVVEPTEDIVISLARVTTEGNILITRDAALVTIADNDGEQTLSFVCARFEYGETNVEMW